ncbi:MAG: hypothetical protein ACRDWV_00495 [Acidimicrobiales bacterium]
MGLVAFGLIFVGADFVLLTDEDYQSLRHLALRVRQARRPGRSASESIEGEAVGELVGGRV